MADERIVGLDRLTAKMQRAVKAAALSDAMKRSGLLVAGQAQRNVTTGGASGLRVRTGRLRGSISHRLIHGGKGVRVGVNAKYGRIHEFGGKTPPAIIRPRRKRALAFRTRSGDIVVVRQVNHPGSKIPARPYLRPALKDKRDEILRLVRAVYAGPLNLGVR